MTVIYKNNLIMQLGKNFTKIEEYRILNLALDGYFNEVKLPDQDFSTVDVRKVKKTEGMHLNKCFNSAVRQLNKYRGTLFTAIDTIPHSRTIKLYWGTEVEQAKVSGFKLDMRMNLVPAVNQFRMYELLAWLYTYSPNKVDISIATPSFMEHMGTSYTYGQLNKGIITPTLASIEELTGQTIEFTGNRNTLQFKIKENLIF